MSNKSFAASRICTTAALSILLPSRFEEDKENRPENLAVAYTLDDCIRDIEENPLYVVGEWQKNAFGSYHNFYAVFGVSLTED